MPKITVLLPVYNAEKYLKEAIDSILSQTYDDFELWIFNDGSTDNSLQIIQSFDDDRIRLFDNKINKGYVHYLNYGLENAKTPYIARFDADDIAMPNRFEEQLNFLEKNKNYAIVGTQAFLLQNSQKTTQLLSFLPTNIQEIKLFSYFSCPFIHPSVMFRQDILQYFRYNNIFMPAEDYELWSRIIQKYPVANIAKPLLYYRVHSTNISTTKRTCQLKSIRAIYQTLLKQSGMNFKEYELESHLKLSGSYTDKIDEKEVNDAEKWLIKLEKHFMKQKLYSDNEIQEVLMNIWYLFAIKFTKYLKIKGFKIFMNSKFSYSKSNKSKLLLFLHAVGHFRYLNKIYLFFKTSLYNSKY